MCTGIEYFISWLPINNLSDYVTSYDTFVEYLLVGSGTSAEVCRAGWFPGAKHFRKSYGIHRSIRSPESNRFYFFLMMLLFCYCYYKNFWHMQLQELLVGCKVLVPLDRPVFIVLTEYEFILLLEQCSSSGRIDDVAHDPRHWELLCRNHEQVLDIWV